MRIISIIQICYLKGNEVYLPKQSLKGDVMV